MKKRTLSLSLCSLYLLAILPTGAFSVEGENGNCCGFISSNNCLFSSSTKHASRHWISSTNTDARVVEIEDGSRWKLSSTYNLRSWKSNDTVTITPNHNTSSEYNYYVVNKSTGGYTEANLILGPVARGPLTHWAIGFDFTKNQVFLENDSCWKISENDAYIMQEWEPNDTIIIGSNDSWFSSFDAILINVNMNNYVRARAY
ncbi:MAG: hypothetical protein FJZ57_05900 [Chlamydiae bacterium]|nr:hypothetical protein [Chlamydiota bacterium]